MERKTFDIEIKHINQDTLTVETCISSERLDRVGDIMIQDGMTVEEGSRPVVLFAHGFSESMGQEPIAKILRLWKGEQGGYKATFASIQFYDGPNERRLYDKLINGYIHSFSIGYAVDEFYPINNGTGRRVVKWRLLEISLVAIPAQIDAHVIESGNFEGLQCKFFSHQRPSPPIRIEDIQLHLGKGKFCSFKEFPNILENIIRELICKEIRRAKGRVD
jgi:HK97 family phage prohead protease